MGGYALTDTETKHNLWQCNFAPTFAFGETAPRKSPCEQAVAPGAHASVRGEALSLWACVAIIFSSKKMISRPKIRAYQVAIAMQAVILARGLGTRISEESHLRPKPMIEIGGRPILWHVMEIYAAHGITDFVICLGYRGYMIKEYFANYMLHASDVTIDARTGKIVYHQSTAEPWRVSLIDTGDLTQTGGRLKRVAGYLGDRFCMTYGDGVADINVAAEIDFHLKHGREATVAAVIPPGRYGALQISEAGAVERFIDPPPGDEGRINGGFFVLERSVLDRIDADMTPFEAAPLEGLARDGQLMAYPHRGFWHAMDTIRDKVHLEQQWQAGRAPWKVWA